MGVLWLFDEKAVDVIRYFTKLKNSLMPYLFHASVENNQTGDTFDVEADIGDHPFHIYLVGHTKVESTSSGSWNADEKGVKVSPEKSVTKFSITL